QSVSLSPASVVRAPPFSRLDLISCRNLLIYLKPALQEQIIPLFHYALRPSGYLFRVVGERRTIRRVVPPARQEEPHLSAPRYGYASFIAVPAVRVGVATGRGRVGREPQPAAAAVGTAAQRRQHHRRALWSDLRHRGRGWRGIIFLGGDGEKSGVPRRSPVS